MSIIDLLKKNTFDTDQIINSMFENYNMYESNNEAIDKINQDNNFFNYLKDNYSDNIYKYYTNYSIINKDIWYNLIKLFYWDIEIQAKAFFLPNNNIIIQYDENNFEIVVISDFNINQQLLFCIYENDNTSKIINEIQNIGISGYYQKYYINILYTNQSSQELIDYGNNNQYLGKIININAAKNNYNDFTLLIYEQLDKDIKDNIRIGLNKIKMNNNTFNNNINNVNNNNNFNKQIINRNMKQPMEIVETKDVNEINTDTSIKLKKAFTKKAKNFDDNDNIFDEKNNDSNGVLPFNNNNQNNFNYL